MMYSLRSLILYLILFCKRTDQTIFPNPHIQYLPRISVVWQFVFQKGEGKGKIVGTFSPLDPQMETKDCNSLATKNAQIK